MTKNKIIKNKQYKFSRSQLSFFAKEMNEAGGFDDLMLKKKAIEQIDGRMFIITHQDIKKYKNTFLTGIYKSLRPVFNTKVPYSFWSQIYIALKRNMSPSKLQ
jgi:hypothetical protein